LFPFFGLFDDAVGVLVPLAYLIPAAQLLLAMYVKFLSSKTFF
jgi:hypothetical protein